MTPKHCSEPQRQRTLPLRPPQFLPPSRLAQHLGVGDSYSRSDACRHRKAANSLYFMRTRLARQPLASRRLHLSSTAELFFLSRPSF